MSEIPSIPNDPADIKGWVADLSPDDLRALTQQLLGGSLTRTFTEDLIPRNAPIKMPPAPKKPTMLTFTIELTGSQPRIWRRLVLPGNLTLDAVHPLLQAAMGWSDSHLHRFQPGAGKGLNTSYFITSFDEEEGDEGTRESDVRLDQVLREPGDRLTYLYDFGDDWDHVLTLESVQEVAAYGEPRCLKGAKACPREDVGGIYTHNDVANWLRSGGALPGFFESAEQLRTWLGPDYDPDHFDAEGATEDMRIWAAGEHLPWHGLPAGLTELITARGLGSPQIYQWLDQLGSRTPVELSEADVFEAAHPWYVVLHAIWPKVKLTDAGYLPPSIVVALATDLGITQWWIGKANREDLLPPVAQLREAAQDVGLLRKAKGYLAPTARADKMSKDPHELVRYLLTRLPVGKGFEAEAGWLYLLGLAAGDNDIDRGVAQVLTDRGWRTRGTSHLSPRDAQRGALRTELVLAWMCGGQRSPDWHKMHRLARAALFGVAPG